MLGPAVVYTAAREHVAALIRRGYIQVIFGGNAIVAHDVGGAMSYSLGIDLKDGAACRAWPPASPAHDQRGARGGIAEAAREQGLLGNGIAAALEQGVEMVLAGSIRDDGPMPGVITDAMRQGRRAAAHGVEVAVMAASMLHAIATGNLAARARQNSRSGHQPGGGDEARRSRHGAGNRPGDRRRALPRAGG